MLKFSRQSPEQKSDPELVDLYKSTGEMKYLGVLFDRYLELIYGNCLKVLQDEAQAEDAVMSIFEELVKKVKKHEIKQFRGWLHVLSRNFCLMQLRKQKKDLTKSYEPEVMQLLDLAHPLEESRENRQEKALQPCLQQLPESQRLCIEAFYLEGLTYKEIASDRKEEVGKVRSYIQNGRRNLKNCIEQQNESYIRK